MGNIAPQLATASSLDLPAPPRRRRRWPWVVAVVALALGAAGTWYVAFRTQPPAASEQPSLRAFEVVAIDERRTVEASGNVEPSAAADVGFSVAGWLDTLVVAVGQSVETGAPLASLDSAQQRYNLAALDVDIAEEQVSGSARRLELLRLERGLLSADLAERSLAAPIGGVVADVGVSAGDWVPASDTVARIIDTSSLVATVEVDELDILAVREGQNVRFIFDALPDTEVWGVVSDLPREGRVTSQGIAVMDVELTIGTPDARLLPGFSFTAEIVVAEAERVLLVSEEAIIQRGDTQIALLAGAEGETPIRVPVSTAPYGEGQVRVLEGLEAGDVVVAPVAQPTGGVAARPEDGAGFNLLGTLAGRGVPGAGGPGGRPPGGGGNGGAR